MPMFLLINIGGHRVVWNAGKTFQYCLKDYLRATARYSHANLLAHTFLVSFKHKIIRESLKSCTFSVSQRTRFCPVINVCSSAPAPSNCICGFVWVEPFVNLADFCAGNIQLQIFGQIGCECVLPRFNILQPFNNSCRLLCCIVIRGISGDGRDFDCGLASIVDLCIRSA